MLLQAKAKRAQKKFNKTAINSLKSISSLTSNPEIQMLIEKLQTITDDIHEQKLSPLNLVQWKKNKYRPTESENRIKIQNRISMKKAEDVNQQKLRPRIKPIKRFSVSEEKQKRDNPLSYKEHYKEIILFLKNKKLFDEESEEQVVENKDTQAASYEGFKYYNNIKKYSHLVSYIQEKINEKEAEKLPKRSVLSHKTFHTTSNSVWNERSSNRMKLKSQTVMIGDKQSQLKIGSIIKKWNPQNRTSKRIFSCDPRYGSRSKLKSKQLAYSTSKLPSPRPTSDRNQQDTHQIRLISEISKAK